MEFNPLGLHVLNASPAQRRKRRKALGYVLGFFGVAILAFVLIAWGTR